MRHFHLQPAPDRMTTRPASKPRPATPGALTGPLSNEQKASVCILARDAYALQFVDQEYSEWRRDQQLAAVGKASLLDCTQDDFLRLRSWFQRLAGEEGDSIRTGTHHTTEPLRVAMHKLCEQVRERGLSIAYAESICQRQYKCPLEKANVKQVWCLVYTIRNRRKPTK